MLSAVVQLVFVVVSVCLYSTYYVTFYHYLIVWLRRWNFRMQNKAKKVLIIGSGVGGLNTGIILVKLGYDVTILKKIGRMAAC